MEYNRAKTIDFFFDEINSGNMEFSDMRKRLEKGNVEDDEIKVVVKQVDKQLQRFAQNKSNQELGKNIMFGGLFISFIGLFITIATFTGIIDFGNYFILAYGPVGAGLIITFQGRSRMNGK
ncbi:MAG: hypothetical protein ABFR62_12520 [Bacteroidota bacterium]